MSLIDEIGVSILGAVVGAVLPLLLPYIARRRRNLAQGDLLGKWNSLYQTETSQEWVSENVTLEVRGSQIRLTNSDNSLGYVYEGFATFDEGELTGTWKSTRGEGGNARGSFLLTVIPAGGLLYGFYTGPRETGERVFRSWILGKTMEKIEKGKVLISSQALKA